MSHRPSSRIVLAAIAVVVCTEAIAENGVQVVGVNVAECCVKDVNPCIVQGAAKTFQFEDADTTVDYSSCTEINFDVWQNTIAGANLLSVSLTGGDITIAAANIFQFTIDNATSLALLPGTHYCEAWVTLSTGERRAVGIGRFKVTDSRKYD